MHLPEFKHSRRCSSPSTKDSERGETEREGDPGGPHKSVSMAPTSRYLTDRQYVTRKPLFSAEHTSILKKTHPLKHTEKEKQFGVSGRDETQQHTGMNFLTRPGEELTPESFSPSHSNMSPPSVTRTDFGSPLRVSELSARLCHDGPTFASPFPGSRSARRKLSSSILEVQRIKPPLRPQLTSTVLHPTYSPRSEYSRPGRTQLRLGGREGRAAGETKLYSSAGNSEGHPVSSYQANYWACAIPKTLPPSPDRQSSDWNPNREYQALLDYTYPLRPGQVACEEGSSKIRGHSEPNLQDSGIELDHRCSSTSLSGLDLSLSAGHRSPDLQRFNRSSDGEPSSTLLSLTDPVGLSLDSLDCSKSRGEPSHCRFDGHHCRQHAPSSTFTAFTRSTSFLPKSRCVGGEVDEEFRPLPEQLEELQLLSRQVREVTAQLSRPVTASWDSLEPGTTSILSSVTLPEKQEAEDEEDEAKVKELESGNQDTDEGKDETDREERRAAQTADHRDCELVSRSSGVWEEPVGGGLSPSSLREVEVLVQQLCGISLPSSQEDQDQSDSLMQHIQVFCSHLEQLIQQLYTVSEKMELLAAPTVDINSVRSSLAEYQSFQREVSSHQPLTSCVLHTGQLLLSCIGTMSPLLRDTLLLIERQSGALESHTQHFFSSILSAMDNLTQPSQPAPVQQSTEEVLGSTM